MRRLASLLTFGLICVALGFGLGLHPSLFQASFPESTICVGATTPLAVVVPPSYLAPFASWHELPPAQAYLTDSSGIPVSKDATFHPGNTASLGIRVLNDGDVGRARGLADRLMAEGESKPDGLWFPYRFSYDYDGQPVRAPWYSGFAQGQALSFLSRLFERTHDERYGAAARAVRRSLEPGNAVAKADHRVEEIPLGNTILNGWIFAALGIYEYARVFDDQASRALFLADVSAIRSDIHRYIGANAEVWYDLQHHTMGPGYIALHLELTSTLAAHTGERCLDDAARAYAGSSRARCSRGRPGSAGRSRRAGASACRRQGDYRVGDSVTMPPASPQCTGGSPRSWHLPTWRGGRRIARRSWRNGSRC